MFKNIVRTLILGCFVCVLALCKDPAQSNDRLPVVVLIETNPWLWVLGSDSPVFALYEDGLLIFAKKEEALSLATYYSAVLTKSATDSLISSLFLSGLNFLPDNSVGTELTDQPKNILLFSDGNDLKEKTAYGDLRTDTSVRRLIPKSFVQIFDRLANFQLPHAKPWLPEKVELLLQRYKGSEQPFPWPNDWPEINSDNSIRRGELTSFFIDSKYFEELQNLFKKMKLGQPLLISGKKWNAMYRFPFPHEEIWVR